MLALLSLRRGTKVAKWVDMPLNIVGPVRHPGYFCKKVRKKLNEKITYHGEAMGEIKKHLLLLDGLKYNLRYRIFVGLQEYMVLR